MVAVVGLPLAASVVLLVRPATKLAQWAQEPEASTSGPKAAAKWYGTCHVLEQIGVDTHIIELNRWLHDQIWFPFPNTSSALMVEKGGGQVDVVLAVRSSILFTSLPLTSLDSCCRGADEILLCVIVSKVRLGSG